MNMHLKSAPADGFRRIGLHFALVGLALLGGCAGTDMGATPEERVTRRAQAYLEALIDGDIETAYGFTTPGYRAVSTRNEFLVDRAGVANWTAAELDQVSCEMERCEVRYMVTYSLVRPRIENTRPLEEVWILVDGQWYIYTG